MSNNTPEKSGRNAFEIAHFALGVAGLIVGIAGVVIGSALTAVFGGALVLLALAFFTVTSS